MNRVSKKKSTKQNKSAQLKVVYISSPMKVKTCASNFRSTVQQLTGRDSVVVDRLMDEHANNNNNNIIINNNIFSNELFHINMGGDDEFLLDDRRVEIPMDNPAGNSYESPTSSGSMPFEESVGLFPDLGGGGGGDGNKLDEGFTFDDIFGAAGFLLEFPLDEGMYQ